MQVSVTFRHMDATDALKVMATEKVGRIEKYIHTPTDAHVVLSVERHHHRAEINVTANGVRVHGEETSDDMYKSIDAAAAKIEKQLKRWRNKLASHKPRHGGSMRITQSVVTAPNQSQEELPAEVPTEVVETKAFDATPMLIEEAIMQMELLHEDFHVFLNAKTLEMNVLYRRSDGKYGLIEPRHQNGGAVAR